MRAESFGSCLSQLRGRFSDRTDFLAIKEQNTPMKILHTADLHLGKRFNDVSMLDDQKILLDQIIRIAEQEKPQVILLAGDIYQTSSPGSDAMELFNSFLTAVSALGIPVLMISGNHDSQIRISYLSRLLVKA
ncbi:MAG TPA: hypothetical protein DEP00_04955, partial [Lachnospiraceae bacterium]|nr:hypothetical protein [Lachnospiraceae bacterium]